MRKLCWVYYDNFRDQIVLVRRPRRYGHSKMAVASYTDDGFMRDYFYIDSFDFRKNYVYLGGINTNIKHRETSETHGLQGWYVVSPQELDYLSTAAVVIIVFLYLAVTR